MEAHAGMSPDSTNEHVDTRERRIQFQAFKVSGMHTSPGSDCRWTADSSMRLLETALTLAMQEHGPDAVLLKTVSTTARYKAAQRPHRQLGDVVRLDGSQGFGAESGRYRIVGRDEPDSCFSCNVPGCQEWPTLELLDSEGEGTGERAFHVSECAMFDDDMPT